MKILQFTKSELLQIHEENKSNNFLIVESQPYGMDTDICFNCVMPNEIAEEFLVGGLGREIVDKGRTVGFFQHVGGGGVFEPSKALLFPKTALEVIQTCQPATVSFQEKTWNEILQSIPRFNPSFLDSLGLTKKNKRKAKK